MSENFLPQSIAQLTESTSIALAQSIQQEGITTPLTPEPIATTYVRQGSGNTPLLLVHGFDSSVFEFRRLLPLLAQQNETWAVDLLGFGFTERAPGLPFSQKAIASHLYYFWKTLISQPVILVGASMGGAAAIDFALNHPEAVEKLVLIDSAGFAVTSNKGRFLIPPLGYLATSFLRNPKFGKKLASMLILMKHWLLWMPKLARLCTWKCLTGIKL